MKTVPGPTVQVDLSLYSTYLYLLQLTPQPSWFSESIDLGHTYGRTCYQTLGVGEPGAFHSGGFSFVD